MSIWQINPGGHLGQNLCYHACPEGFKMDPYLSLAPKQVPFSENSRTRMVTQFVKVVPPGK